MVLEQSRGCPLVWRAEKGLRNQMAIRWRPQEVGKQATRKGENVPAQGTGSAKRA